MGSLAWLPPFLRDAPAWTFVAAGAAIVAVIAGVVARRTRAARRRVAAALAEPYTVRGVLRADRAVVSVAVVAFAGEELAEIATRSADELAIERADGSRVVLDGTVAIVVGSRVVRHHAIPTEHFELATVARDRARRAMQLGAWRGGIDAYHVRSIAPGDELVARGVLDGDRLVPPSIVRPIELASLRGTVDPAPMPPLAGLARAALAGAATWLLAAALAASL